MIVAFIVVGFEASFLRLRQFRRLFFYDFEEGFWKDLHVCGDN